MPFWLPLIFGAAGVAGAIIEANGKKTIDPAWLEEQFGAHAFSREFQKQFNAMQGTAYGQEMVNAAMSQGQQMANTIRQNAAAAGFGGPEGVQSGGSLFATSTADQATGSMRRMAQAALAEQAAKQVQSSFDTKKAFLLQQAQQPSKQEVLGAAIKTGGLMGLQASLASKSPEAAALVGAGADAAGKAGMNQRQLDAFNAQYNTEARMAPPPKSPPTTVATQPQQPLFETQVNYGPGGEATPTYRSRDFKPGYVPPTVGSPEPISFNYVRRRQRPTPSFGRLASLTGGLYG